LFPQAKLIHTVFDVRRVVSNLVAQPMPSKQTYTVDAAVDLWLRTTRACLEAEMAYGSERVLRLHYRDLLRDPEAVMRRCMQFLDESYDEACLRPFTGLADPLTAEGMAGSEDAGVSGILEEALLLSDLLAFDASQWHAPDPERMAKLEARSVVPSPAITSAAAVETPTTLGGKVRQAAAAVVPANASVLVISKGDEDLVQLNGIRASHFPGDASGRYAGYHPASASEAISQLEQARAAGGNYLIVPAPYAWWLEYYAELRDHLLANYRLVYLQEASCSIFSLLRRSTDDDSLAAKLFQRAIA
jgi:hypothetical protein